MDNLRVMITDRETVLVRRIARDVYSTYCMQGSVEVLSREDLYHYGIVGLLEAKKNFDSTRSVPWLAFAAFRVRGAMLDQLRVEPIIRLPQAVRQKVKMLKAAEVELTQTGMKANPLALSRRLEWPLSEVHRVMGLCISLIPVAEPSANADEKERYQGHVLTDEAPDPEKETLKKEIAVLVRKCLEALPTPEDRLVITGRFLEGLKLREIAETLGCSVENVRQKQMKLEKSLKTCIERHGWEAEN